MIRFDKGVSRKEKEWDVICPPFIIIYIYLIIVPFSKVSLLNFIVANCVYSYPRRKVEWIDTINLAHLTRQLNPHCYIQSEQLLRKERDVSVPQHHSDSIIAQFSFTFIKSRSLWFNIVIPMFRLIVKDANLLLFFIHDFDFLCFRCWSISFLLLPLFSLLPCTRFRDTPFRSYHDMPSNELQNVGA